MNNMFQGSHFFDSISSNLNNEPFSHNFNFGSSILACATLGTIPFLTQNNFNATKNFFKDKFRNVFEFSFAQSNNNQLGKQFTQNIFQNSLWEKPNTTQFFDRDRKFGGGRSGGGDRKFGGQGGPRRGGSGFGGGRKFGEGGSRNKQGEGGRREGGEVKLGDDSRGKTFSRDRKIYNDFGSKRRGEGGGDRFRNKDSNNGERGERRPFSQNRDSFSRERSRGGDRDRRGGGGDRFGSGERRREGGFGGQRREGGFGGGERRQGGFGGQRREGGFGSGERRREGGFSGGERRREGGFSGGERRREGGFSGGERRREGGFGSGERRQGGFGGQRREGGFGGGERRREGGFSGGERRREGGFGSGDRRREGSGERRREGGFGGGERRREGGFGSGERRREGGFASGERRREGRGRENSFRESRGSRDRGSDKKFDNKFEQKVGDEQAPPQKKEQRITTKALKQDQNLRYDEKQFVEKLIKKDRKQNERDLKKTEAGFNVRKQLSEGGENIDSSEFQKKDRSKKFEATDFDQKKSGRIKKVKDAVIDGASDLMEKGGYDPFENPNFSDPRWNEKINSKYEKDMIKLMDMMDKEDKKARKGQVGAHVSEDIMEIQKKYPNMKETFDVEENFEKQDIKNRVKQYEKIDKDSQFIIDEVKKLQSAKIKQSNLVDVEYGDNIISEMEKDLQEPVTRKAQKQQQKKMMKIQEQKIVEKDGIFKRIPKFNEWAQTQHFTIQQELEHYFPDGKEQIIKRQPYDLEHLKKFSQAMQDGVSMLEADLSRKYTHLQKELVEKKVFQDGQYKFTKTVPFPEEIKGFFNILKQDFVLMDSAQAMSNNKELLLNWIQLKKVLPRSVKFAIFGMMRVRHQAWKSINLLNKK